MQQIVVRYNRNERIILFTLLQTTRISHQATRTTNCTRLYYYTKHRIAVAGADCFVFTISPHSLAGCGGKIVRDYVSYDKDVFFRRINEFARGRCEGKNKWVTLIQNASVKRNLSENGFEAL